MEKRVLTNYKKLPVEIKRALKKEYPDGFDNILTTVKFITNGESISALIYTYNETRYLIQYTRMKRKESRLNDSEEIDEESDGALNNSIGGEWFEYEN